MNRGERHLSQAVILIACANNYVICRHTAESENSKGRGCLMRRIAPPDMLVCDGTGGIGKAMRAWRPSTRMRRRAFHAFCQIKRRATARPKTQAGVGLYKIAKDLMHIETNTEAAVWTARFQGWRTDYEGFLKERSEADRKRLKHEKPRKARRILAELCSSGALFTHLEGDLQEGGPIPSMSNRIEDPNGRTRRMPSAHRGMNVDHRVKAAFWFCCMESEEPVSHARMVREFPTDEGIARWRDRAARQFDDDSGSPARWGEGLVWPEFHHGTPHPYAID